MKPNAINNQFNFESLYINKVAIADTDYLYTATETRADDIGLAVAMYFGGCGIRYAP